jgi:hypothetical protein
MAVGVPQDQEAEDVEVGAVEPAVDPPAPGPDDGVVERDDVDAVTRTPPRPFEVVDHVQGRGRHEHGGGRGQVVVLAGSPPRRVDEAVVHRPIMAATGSL